MSDDFDKAPHCPKWDGNPLSWRKWLEDVKIWKLACKRPKAEDTWPAGKMIQSLSGAARHIALRLPEAQLTATQESPWKGIDSITQLLQQELIPSQELRQADAVSRFFEQETCSRKAGQSIHAFNSFFLAEVQKLQDESVNTDKLLLGWWWMKRARIVGERRERLIAMLASRDGDPPSYDDLPAFMAAGSRLFHDLHKYEQPRLLARGTTSTTTTSSSSKQGQRRYVHVSETVDQDTMPMTTGPSQQAASETPEEEEEEDALHEHLMAEAAQLAEEVREVQQPEEADKYIETMETLAVAADSLAALRPARKGRGKHKGTTSTSTTSSTQARSGKGRSGISAPAARTRDIQRKKAQSTCRACGEKGHWAGDPECPVQPGHDTLAIVNQEEENMAEVLTISTLAVAEEDTEEHQTKITLDSGSNHNVIGQETLAQIKAVKPKAILRYVKSPVQLAYRFGGGEVEKTDKRVVLYLPFLPRDHREVTFSVVGSSAKCLPPLLGREYLDDAGATVDFRRAVMTVPDKGRDCVIALHNTKQGHLGHALSAQVDDCGALFSAQDHKEQISENQARRWTQTKSRNMSRLRRRLSLLLCASATAGMTSVEQQDLPSVEQIPEQDIRDLIGDERMLKTGTWYQVQSMMRHTSYLVDHHISPADVGASMEMDSDCAIVQEHSQQEDFVKTHLVLMKQQSLHARIRGVKSSSIVYVSDIGRLDVMQKKNHETCLIHLDFNDEKLLEKMDILQALAAQQGVSLLGWLDLRQRTTCPLRVLQHLRKLRQRWPASDSRWVAQVPQTSACRSMSQVLRKYFICEASVKSGYATKSASVLHQSFVTGRLDVTHQKQVISRVLRSFLVRPRLAEGYQRTCSRVVSWLRGYLLPLSVGRTHVFSRKKSELLRGIPLGAIVSRGRGVAAHTSRYAEVLPQLHRLARTLPAYASFQLNQMEPCVHVKRHVDIKNDGDSYVMIFGSFKGGILFVKKDGRWHSCPDRCKWHRIPAGCPHYVSAVTSGHRYSLVAYTPKGALALSHHNNEELMQYGFPIDEWRQKRLQEEIMTVLATQNQEHMQVEPPPAPPMPNEDDSVQEEQRDSLPNWAPGYPRRGRESDPKKILRKDYQYHLEKRVWQQKGCMMILVIHQRPSY